MQKNLRCPRCGGKKLWTIRRGRVRCGACRYEWIPGCLPTSPNSGHAGLGYVVKALVSSLFVRRQGRPIVAVPKNEDLGALKGLIEAGKVTPVIDRTFPLSETPEAFRYLDKEHARGKVVITVDHNNRT